MESGRPEGGVRFLDVPVQAGVQGPEGLLADRLGSKRAAERAILEVSREFGLEGAPRSASAAVALAKLGLDLDRVAKSLGWKEFEEFCAMAVSAAGYHVRRDVHLRKPRRQIDIVAESPSLVLVIDCKHWSKGAGASSLALLARAQAERARMLAEATGRKDKPHLPVLLTVLENQVRVEGGVPVVPLHALKEFLSSVNGFDWGLS